MCCWPHWHRLPFRTEAEADYEAIRHRVVVSGASLRIPTLRERWVVRMVDGRRSTDIASGCAPAYNAGDCGDRRRRSQPDHAKQVREDFMRVAATLAALIVLSACGGDGALD